MRALLVDDEKAFADVLAERLTARGVTVRVAYDAAEALYQARAEDFDVAVLDVNLPGMSGIELLTRLKEVRPLIEAVMLSGASDLRTAVEGMRRGAFNYLVKPARFESLLAEMRQAKEKRVRQEERARLLEAAKLASLGRLAEGVAHEINNPVNIVATEAGWLEDLLEEGEPDESRLDELRRVAAEIRRQSRRIGEITRKLLFFGKGLDPRPRRVDIPSLLSDVLARCRERAETLGARLELDVREDLPEITASPTELKQIFLHLAENGLDALEAAGAGPDRLLRVEAERRPAGDEPEELLVRFLDTGVGVAPEAMPHLFEPFFSTKKVGEGMGLGLSAAYGAVSSLGGGIEVDSAPGRTVFTIRLPLEKGTPPAT